MDNVIDAKDEFLSKQMIDSLVSANKEMDEKDRKRSLPLDEEELFSVNLYGAEIDAIIVLLGMSSTQDLLDAGMAHDELKAIRHLFYTLVAFKDEVNDSK